MSTMKSIDSFVVETLRWIASVRLLGEEWRATLYGQYYDWRMLSNPTHKLHSCAIDGKAACVSVTSANSR